MWITTIICFSVFAIVHRICVNDERNKELQIRLDSDKLQLERDKLEQKQLASKSSHY